MHFSYISLHTHNNFHKHPAHSRRAVSPDTRHKPRIPEAAPLKWVNPSLMVTTDHKPQKHIKESGFMSIQRWLREGPMLGNRTMWLQDADQKSSTWVNFASWLAGQDQHYRECCKRHKPSRVPEVVGAHQNCMSLVNPLVLYAYLSSYLCLFLHANVSVQRFQEQNPSWT